jgi:uncharacterized protein YhbP (UPF0306 family)
MSFPKRITNFIQSQKAATVCCVSADGPYCFNCYYVFDAENGWIIYKSGLQTKHEKLLQENAQVAGTIIPEKIELNTLQGVQFEGIQLDAGIDTLMKASTLYYLKYPFAVAVPGNIKILSLDRIKYTDNTLGFGHKEHWEREKV